MTTAETIPELDATTRRRSDQLVDLQIALRARARQFRRLADDPRSWRLGARTPASWTLAAAFLLAGAGGIAFPAADVRSDPGRPPQEAAVAVPPVVPAPDEDPHAALAPPIPADTMASADVPIPAVAGPVAAKRTIPLGKGMWLNNFAAAHGGDPKAIVRHAQENGLTHLYVRTGSSRMGFYAAGDLNKILPVAHAAGIKVVGWDFPYFNDVFGDADRGKQAIDYTTPDGHRIDAFSADIETRSEGTNLTTANATEYGVRLRQLAGDDYPLIATVPRPNPKRWYPYPEVVDRFDAIAPMVYWINRDPVSDLVGAVNALAPYGKPILPVGQAYDPGIDGLTQWAVPGKAQIAAFMQSASEAGIASISFWAWNTATGDHWAAIRESDAFDTTGLNLSGDAKSVATLQRLLRGLRYETAVDGVFGPQTGQALAQFQTRHGLPASGLLDRKTIATLVKLQG